MAIQRFWGTNEDDRIQGTIEADILRGRDGNDIYTVNNEGDVVQEKYHQGMDTIRTFVSTSIPLNIEKVFIIGEPWKYDYQSDVSGNIQDNYVSGNCGENVINGKAGDDTLFGGRGNDTVYGGTGDDFMGGGIGLDYMNDIKGNDTYFYNLNENRDTIVDFGGKDRLVFGDDISKENLDFHRNGDELVIDAHNNDDKVIIEDYFKTEDDGSHPYAIESFQFANGDSYDFYRINRMISFHNSDNSDIVQIQPDNQAEPQSYTAEPVTQPIAEPVSTGFHMGGHMFGSL